MNNADMDRKLELTVERTIEAIARIQRFIEKYGSQLSKNQLERIFDKIDELRKSK